LDHCQDVGHGFTLLEEVGRPLAGL
jgi:hypothetical protein